MGVHHGFIERVAANGAGFGDIHLAHHHQAVDMRIQRTEAIGEQLRQHRDDLTGEVNRVSTRTRFIIQRSAGSNIVRHIGNRYQQLPTTGFGLPSADSIVEVFGRFVINGDKRNVTQIDAMLFILLQDLGRDFAGLIQHLWRKLGGDVIAANGNVDLHARIHTLTQHFDDFTHRLHPRGGLLHDLGRNDLAVFGTPTGGMWDDHLLRNTRVFRNQHAKFRRVTTVHTDNGLSIAGNHIDNGRFVTTATVTTTNAYQHVVPVKYTPHLTRRQDEIWLFAIISEYEAKTIAMPKHLTFNQIELIDQRVSTSSITQHLPVALHSGQAPTHGF